MKNLITPFILAASTATVLQADVPNVVTDIAPVHALVSQVMQGVGAPQLVIPTSSSPHHFAMRPSEAQMLAQADVVVWIGHGLTPWLEGPIEKLAGQAQVIELMEAEGVNLLSYREGALFEAGDHEAEDDHDDHGHKEDGHDDHADEDHADDNHADDDHKDHKEHKEEGHKDDGHDDHAGHAHGEGGNDPHVWLDPDNGNLFLDLIAAELSKQDPENAATYAKNAKEGQAVIAETADLIDAKLAEVRGVPFIVLHDAFHYFEHHFEIEALGAVSAGDAASPGGARITALRAALPDSKLRCAFAEPQVSTRVLDTVTEGLDVRTAVLDPLGAELELGATLYKNLLMRIGAEMAECLKP